MTYLRRYLDDDPTVVVVGADNGETLARAVPEYDFQFVSETTAAHDVVGDHVVCLYIASPVPADVGVELAKAVLEADDTIPVLVSTAESSGQRAAEIGAVGATYVPPALDENERRGAIERAAQTGERRRSDALLSDAFEQLLDNSEETIYVKNTDGRYLMISTPSKRPDPAEFLGKTDAEIASERDEGSPVLERRHEATMAVVESGEPISHNVDRFGQDEATFWIDQSLFPWRVDGTIEGVIGIERTVSQRYKARKEMQTRIDQLEQFTSYVAHDLRSPLNVAESYIELAAAGDETAFERVRAANDRMQELIDDLETLVGGEPADIDGGRTVELVEIARDVWSVIETPSSTLRIDVPAETIVNAPESTIRPILENLFRMAIPDSPGPGATTETPAVTVRVEALSDGFAVVNDSPGTSRSPADTSVGFEIVENAIETEGWTLDVSERQPTGQRYEIGELPHPTQPLLWLR